MSKEILGDIQIRVQNFLNELEPRESSPSKIRVRTRTTRVLFGPKRLVVVMEKDINKPFISNFGAKYFQQVVQPKAQRPFALFLNAQSANGIPSVSVFMVVDFKTPIEEIVELAKAEYEILDEAWFFMETSM